MQILSSSISSDILRKYTYQLQPNDFCHNKSPSVGKCAHYYIGITSNISSVDIVEIVAHMYIHKGI